VGAGGKHQGSFREALGEERRHEIRRRTVRRGKSSEDGESLDQHVCRHPRFACESFAGRSVALVPAGEARHDHARIDRPRSPARPLDRRPHELVGQGRKVFVRYRDSASGTPRQGHGDRRRLDLDPSVALADFDDPPMVEAKANPQRLRMPLPYHRS
jgi:hypothetical protein